MWKIYQNAGEQRARRLLYSFSKTRSMTMERIVYKDTPEENWPGLTTDMGA